MEPVDEPLCIEVQSSGDDYVEAPDFDYSPSPPKKAKRDGPGKPSTSAQHSRDEEKDQLEEKLAIGFYKIAGEDERLDPFELQRVMAMLFHNEFPQYSDFGIEASRAMIASMDRDRRGSLNFMQSKELYKKVMRWTDVFESCDTDEDTKIGYSELCLALGKLGVHLEKQKIRMLMNRFQNKSNLIEIDDFIQICCKAMSAKESYGLIKDGTADLDKFMLHLMYN